MIFAIFLLCLSFILSFYACSSEEVPPVIRVSLSEEFKREYFVGEPFEEGGFLDVTEDATQLLHQPVTEDMVTGFDSSTAGEFTIHVESEGFGVDEVIRIKQLTAKSVEIDAESVPSVVFLGEGFPAGVTLTAVMADGSIREHVPVTTSMLGKYDLSIVGTQTIPISYFGKQAILALVVKEEEPISVSLEGAQQEYAVGEELHTEGVMLNVLYDSGKVVSLPFEKSMVPRFTTERGNEEGYTVNVTYGGMTCEYHYRVIKQPVSLTYNLNVFPTVFEKGAAFPSGGVAILRYDDGTAQTFTLSAENAPGFTEAVSMAGEEKSVDICCAGVTSSTPYVFAVLPEIVDALPYDYTEIVRKDRPFNGEGKLKIFYEEGFDSEIIPFTDSRLEMVYSTDQAGRGLEQKVRFRGREYSFYVTVYDPNDKTISDIEIPEDAFRYLVAGEARDPSAITVRILYEWLEPKIESLRSEWVTYDLPDSFEGDTAPGRVIVKIGDFEKVVENVTVLSAEYASRVTNFFVYNLQTIYVVGEPFNPDRGGATAVFGGGYDVRPLSLSETEPVDFDTSQAGNYSFTLSYGDMTCAPVTYRVISAEETELVTDIRLSGFAPLLFEDDTLSDILFEDVNGNAIYRLILEKGYGYSQTTIPITNDLAAETFSFEGRFSEENRLITISYADMQTTVSVTVYPKADKDKVTAIAFRDQQLSTDYGEALDLSQYYLTVIRGYGASQERISLDAEGVTISAYSVVQTGTQYVVISYANMTCQTDVFVRGATRFTVALREGSKQEFTIGESWHDVELLVTYEGGRTEIIPVAYEDVRDAFDTTEPGENKQLTIEYGGQGVQYTYRVVAAAVEEE